MWLDASWNTSSQAKPISIKLQNKTTNQVLDGPALTLTGVRLTGLIVKSFFLRTLDLGMRTFGTDGVTRCDDVLKPNAGTTAGDQPRSEEHTSELQSQFHLVCRLLLEKK